MSSKNASSAGRPSSSIRILPFPRVTVRGFPSGVQPWLSAVVISTAAGESATPLRHPVGAAGLMRRHAGRRRQASYQKAAGTGCEAFHRFHRLGMARVDMGKRERHTGRREPIRFLRRESRTRFAASREQTVAVLRDIDDEGGRPGLAVVLLARCDHAVSGSRDPIRHAGALPQGRDELIEIRCKRLGGVKDAELALGAGKLRPEIFGDGAPVAPKANRRHERLATRTAADACARIGG